MDRALTPEKCCNFTYSRHCTPTCTHAINGGKQRVLLLRKVFMLHRSSSLILLLSPLGLFVSISWRIPANRELNSCLAKIGSLWRKNESVKCDQSCLFSVFGYMYCLHSCVVYLQPDRAEAVLPVLVLEVGWWGYRMVFGCLESLPLCSYDTESPEPLFGAFDLLFLPVGHETVSLMVRDTGLYSNSS